MDAAGSLSFPLPLAHDAQRVGPLAAATVGLAPVSWVHTGGASDGNFLSADGLPNLDGLGPIGDHLHSSREFIRTDTIAPRAQVAALFLLRLSRGEIALG